MTAAPAKTKYPATLAKAVARELCTALRDLCVYHKAEDRPYLVCAGSLRRARPEVGDLELVYVPKHGEVQDGLFTKEADLTEVMLQELLDNGYLRKRPNGQGTEIWGKKNKLAVHVATGLPVDFFATTVDRWHNYLVCRTGGAQTNLRIATRAKERGLAWHPYEVGFSVTSPHVLLTVMQKHPIFLTTGPLEARSISMGTTIPVHSEQDVFALAGLRYLEPLNRI